MLVTRKMEDFFWNLEIVLHAHQRYDWNVTKDTKWMETI